MFTCVGQQGSSYLDNTFWVSSFQDLKAKLLPANKYRPMKAWLAFYTYLQDCVNSFKSILLKQKSQLDLQYDQCSYKSGRLGLYHDDLQTSLQHQEWKRRQARAEEWVNGGILDLRIN